MTTERALEELRFALAEGDALAPPDRLRDRVTTAALRARPAGQAVPVPPTISAPEVFRRTVESFAATLANLSDDEWRRPALRDLDVQQLVGHLMGVERAFQVAFGLRSTDGALAADHIGSTQSTASAQTGRAPADTRREWLSTASASADHVESLDDEDLRTPVTLHGITLPMESMLIVRSFEMWTHEEDIRRATGRPLAAPEPARLSPMTRLAVALLPAGMGRVDRPAVDGNVRLVLTGPGGGTWPAALGSSQGGPVEARLVIDAVLFCRLVANRIDRPARTQS
jgi:uncharacterized protein (TIGR03083 family)